MPNGSYIVYTILDEPERTVWSLPQDQPARAEKPASQKRESKYKTSRLSPSAERALEFGFTRS